MQISARLLREIQVFYFAKLCSKLKINQYGKGHKLVINRYHSL